MSDSNFLATKGGRIPDKFDPRDHYYRWDMSVQPPSFKDLRTELSQFFSPIYNQGNIGSCTANAAIAAYWFEEKKAHRHWAAAGPSRLFAYWLARYYSNPQNVQADQAQDSGSDMRNAMATLQKYGACPEADWPYDGTEKGNCLVPPPASAYADATAHQINRYYRLDSDRPDSEDNKLDTAQKDEAGKNILNTLRQCLAEGYPVAFGFWFYLKDDDTSWDKSQPGEPFTLKDPWVTAGYPRHTFPEDLDARFQANVPTSGHSVLAIGYDDAKQVVLVQNSWGDKWSKDGIFYMPYSWITDFAATNDFWTIRLTEQDAGPRSKMLWEEKQQYALGVA